MVKDKSSYLLNMEPADHKAYKAAAKRAGLFLREWITRSLNRAVRREDLKLRSVAKPGSEATGTR